MSHLSADNHQSSGLPEPTIASNSASLLFITPLLQPKPGSQPASTPHAPPAPTTPSAVCRRPRKIRNYRCSRCGKRGHNVRSCPLPASTWFQQRCGKCGQTGHNARNCPNKERLVCRVCAGTGRLPCSKCNGRVLQRAVLEGQRKIALLTSRKVEHNENEPAVRSDGLVGGGSVLQVRYAKRLLAMKKA